MSYKEFYQNFLPDINEKKEDFLKDADEEFVQNGRYYQKLNGVSYAQLKQNIDKLYEEYMRSINVMLSLGPGYEPTYDDKKLHLSLFLEAVGYYINCRYMPAVQLEFSEFNGKIHVYKYFCGEIC